jgi:hypothetical protein
MTIFLNLMGGKWVEGYLDFWIHNRWGENGLRDSDARRNNILRKKLLIRDRRRRMLREIEGEY